MLRTPLPASCTVKQVGLRMMRYRTMMNCEKWVARLASLLLRVSDNFVKLQGRVKVHYCLYYKSIILQNIPDFHRKSSFKWYCDRLIECFNVVLVHAS
jgi:hypothetical protein